MADQFDDFLASALAPPEREADHGFVARVQARVLLDEALRAQRRGALQRLGLQLLALLAVLAAVVLLSRSPEIAALIAELPAIALLALIALFSMLIRLFTARTGSDDLFRQRPRGFSGA